MIVIYLIQLVDILVRLFIFLILVHVVLSYFMSPFHPIRQTVDRLVEPFLTPIRRVIPLVGMIDFSPLVLLILVQVVGMIINNILRAFL